MPQNTGDRLDRRILELIQEDARISNADLAEKVGLSPSPCWRRVRALEERGVIRSYVTLVTPEAIGLPVNVWVRVTLDEQVERRLEHFETAIVAWSKGGRLPVVRSPEHVPLLIQRIHLRGPWIDAL